MIGGQAQAGPYCRSCCHSLQGTVSRKCPECGRDFDPTNPRTTLAHPHHEIWDWLATSVRLLIRASIVLAVIAFVACIMGFDRPRLLGMLPCLAALAFTVFTFALAACPRVPLSGRLRAAGIIVPTLLVSIDLTRWPLYASFWICRPWAVMIANQVQANGPTPPQQRGTLRRGRVLDNGNVGFQLMGGDNGGIYLVRRAGPLFPDRPDRVWYNTDWENDLGDDWYLVYQD